MTTEEELGILKKLRIKCCEDIILKKTPELPKVRYFITSSRVFKLNIWYHDFSHYSNYAGAKGKELNIRFLEEIVALLNTKFIPSESEIIANGTYTRYNIRIPMSIYVGDTYETLEAAKKAQKTSPAYAVVRKAKATEYVFTLLCLMFLLAVAASVYHTGYPLIGIAILLPFIIKQIIKSIFD